MTLTDPTEPDPTFASSVIEVRTQDGTVAGKFGTFSGENGIAIEGTENIYLNAPITNVNGQLFVFAENEAVRLRSSAAGTGCYMSFTKDDELSYGWLGVTDGITLRLHSDTGNLKIDAAALINIQAPTVNINGVPAVNQTNLKTALQAVSAAIASGDVVDLDNFIATLGE
jgi:hypothetical protein